MKTCRQITTLVNIAGGALLLGLPGTLIGFVSFFAIFSSETTVGADIPVGGISQNADHHDF
jgi:hypothetical protein